MKLKPIREKYYESLPEVNGQQAQGLDMLGFDWNCNEKVFYGGKQYKRPTVALALMFMRKRFGIYQTIYVRSWDEKLFGFTPQHSFTATECIGADLSEFSKKDDNYDGIASFDYEEAESIALTNLIRYYLQNFNRDFSFVKPGAIVYLGLYGMNGTYTTPAKVIEVDMKKRVVKLEMQSGEDDYFEFRSLYKSPEDFVKLNKKKEKVND